MTPRRFPPPWTVIEHARASRGHRSSRYVSASALRPSVVIVSQITLIAR